MGKLIKDFTEKSPVSGLELTARVNGAVESVVVVQQRGDNKFKVKTASGKEEIVKLVDKLVANLGDNEAVLFARKAPFSDSGMSDFAVKSLFADVVIDFANTSFAWVRNAAPLESQCLLPPFSANFEVKGWRDTFKSVVSKTTTPTKTVDEVVVETAVKTVVNATSMNKDDLAKAAKSDAKAAAVEIATTVAAEKLKEVSASSEEAAVAVAIAEHIVENRDVADLKTQAGKVAAEVANEMIQQSNQSAEVKQAASVAAEIVGKADSMSKDSLKQAATEVAVEKAVKGIAGALNKKKKK